MSDRPMKGSKAAKRLAARVKGYEMVSNKQGYKKPGSFKK